MDRIIDLERLSGTRINSPMFRLFTLESQHKNKIQRDASREQKRQLKLQEKEKKKAAILRRKRLRLKPTKPLHSTLETQQRSILQLPLTTLVVPALLDHGSRGCTTNAEGFFHQPNLFQPPQQAVDTATFPQKEKPGEGQSDSEDDKAKADPQLEAGKNLPKRLGEFPIELYGKPVEELDEYYMDKNTFVVVARDRTIYRFSASRGLFLLTPFNPIRRCAIYILTHPVFSLLVMLVILVNCVFMAINQEIPSSEAVFTGIYTVESLIKILARGLIMSRFTYLRDAWNWLDFVVVSLAYITLAFPMGNLAALRTFRVLRALKTVAVVPGLKTIVGALMEAVRRLRDVIILTLFVLSIFALVGLQIYQGTLLNKCVLLPGWMLDVQSGEAVTDHPHDLLQFADNDSHAPYSYLKVDDQQQHQQQHQHQQQQQLQQHQQRNLKFRASIHRQIDNESHFHLNASKSFFTSGVKSSSSSSSVTLSPGFDEEFEIHSNVSSPQLLEKSTGNQKQDQSNFFQRLFHKISKAPYRSSNQSGHQSYLDHINNQSNWIFLPNGTPKICGNGSGMGTCPVNHTCIPVGENPNFGYTNFDNFGYALLCAFRLMTQDCWEVLYQMVLTANGPYHIVFFIIVIFMGSFYLVNLILAIVAMSYDDCQKQELFEDEDEEEEIEMGAVDDEDEDDDDDDDDDGDDDRLNTALEEKPNKEKKEESDSQQTEGSHSISMKVSNSRRLADSTPSSIKTEYALKSNGSNLSGNLKEREKSESCGQLLEKNRHHHHHHRHQCIAIEISDCSLRYVDDDDSAVNQDSKCSWKGVEPPPHPPHPLHPLHPPRPLHPLHPPRPLHPLHPPHPNSHSPKQTSLSPPERRQEETFIFQESNVRHHAGCRGLSRTNQDDEQESEIHQPSKPMRNCRTFGDAADSSSFGSGNLFSRRVRNPSVHLQLPVRRRSRHNSWDGLPVIYHHHPPAGSQKRLVDKVKAAHRASLRRQSLRLRRESLEVGLNKTSSNLSVQPGQNVDRKSPSRQVFEPTHFLWHGAKLQMDIRGSKKLEICPRIFQQTTERRKDVEVEAAEDGGCRTSDLADEDARPSIEYNDLRLLQSLLHDTKKGLPSKPRNLKRYLAEKCHYLLFGWHCPTPMQRFASLVELFIMDAFVDLFITLCIVVNTVFMALDHEGMSFQLAQVLSIGNYVFTAIFTLEALLKIVALGLQQYLRDRWSCFDLVIVVLSLVELGLADVKGLSILRSFRLLRVFKLAKSWPTLNLLIGIIGRTMGALGNLCFVLAIIMFIFAVMGMQLFGEDYTVEKFGEVPRWNFGDFLHSFMIVFRVLCGEWIDSMWNCIHCSGIACIPFFLFTMIIGNLVVLNLFLALLLSSFGAESLQGVSQDDGEVNKLQEAVDRLSRFCRFIKSHVLVCVYHRMKRGSRRKYVPVYRKIDLDGKIWFEDTAEEDIENGITAFDLSGKVRVNSDGGAIPMIKMVGSDEKKYQETEEQRFKSRSGTANYSSPIGDVEVNESIDADFGKRTVPRSLKSLKFDNPMTSNNNNNNNDDTGESDKMASGRSYKQLRQHSLSTSSGCNISTPSCAERESMADQNGHNKAEGTKLCLRSDSTPSSNFRGYETEATSGNDISELRSNSDDDLMGLAGNLEVDGGRFNRGGPNDSISSSSTLSSDLAFYETTKKPLTQQQQQKQLNFQQYLLNLEATEVEIEYITYPDECCPLCLAKCCCCCCPKWWQTNSKRMDSSGMGVYFWKARNSCYALVEHKIFETFIIAMIIISSLTLAVEDKNIHQNPPLKRILKILDKSFSIIFVVEMMIKLMAYGFKKYFTDAWCWLDFIIVAISMVSLAAEGVGMGNIGAFRALRTLRALRPLRAVSRWEGMKVVVNALIQAIPAICNVLLVCLVFWLIFSIMGVNLFGGRFGRCIDQYGRLINVSVVANKNQCLEAGGWDSTNFDGQQIDPYSYNLTWINPKISFDHVLVAYLALFQIATFKGWTDIMNYAIDSKEPGLQPEPEVREYMYLYFVFFIVFGSFFTLNLFIGVIIDNFNMQKRKSGSQQLFMTEDQKKYYNAMKKLGSKQPQKPVPKPRFKCSMLLLHLVSNQMFDVAIMIAILINMFTMALEHYEQSAELSYVLTKVNQLFIAIFTVECLMKLMALRHYYFKQPWNVFDFVVVVLSILAPAFNEIIEKYFVSPTLLRVVRVFRVGRILRLVKSAKGIRTLLFSLAVSLPALVNIGLLLFLIMFIYAIFGMSFFMHVKHNAGIEELFNFETFFRSMTLLFQTSTSAGWDSVLAGLMIEPPYCDPLSGTKVPHPADDWTAGNKTADHRNWIQATFNQNPKDSLSGDDDDRPNGDCGHSGMAVLYLVSYLVVSYLVVINMYIAVILENFSQATDDIKQGLTQDDFDMYYEVWEKFDEKATQFIPLEIMGQFVDALEHPLRLPAPNKFKLVTLNIPICEHDKVHCLDILDALTKNFLGTSGDMGGELAKLKASIGYKPVTSTLLRQREIYCATVIQRAWREHRKRAKMPL